MKKFIAGLAVIAVCTLGALAQPAAAPADTATTKSPIPAPAADSAGATTTGRGGLAGRGASGRAGGRGAGRGAPNLNDAYYKLGPDSQPINGVPKGRWVGPRTLPSEVYAGTQHTYYVYVPAQYDPAKPTALMILNDGQAMMKSPGDVQAQNVLDNLIYRREIPVMFGVFISPGRRPDQPEPPSATGDWGDGFTNRPTEYNTPDDKYARVVVDELMPALKKEFNISPDPDLHGIMGASSGGCAAFAVAWFRPDDFRKLITVVGSFTNLKGEYIYPELVVAADKKPIRIFMQDGRNDNRVADPTRDWFLQNVRLEQALEKKGNEVNYDWGMNNHGQKMGGEVFPEMMRWLWRDQPVSTDPADQTERSFRPAFTPEWPLPNTEPGFKPPTVTN